MEWRYTQSDAHQWAAFSGDFNPIHFDNALSSNAQKMANSVHGMRALLDVKQALANAWLAESDNDWLQFSARLLEPLRCQQRYRFSLEGKNARLAGKLSDAETDRACITARLQRCAVPHEAIEAAITGRLEPQLMQDWINCCPALDLNGVWQWAFLDAALFRVLLHSNALSDAFSPAFPALSQGSLSALFQHVVVVQTHHETRFHQRIINSTHFHPLDWCIQPALLVGDAQKGVVCQLTITAAACHAPLMSSVVTLKTLPWKGPHD